MRCTVVKDEDDDGGLESEDGSMETVRGSERRAANEELEEGCTTMRGGRWWRKASRFVQ